MASKKVLEHYLRQLRLIEEHREKWCYENVRRHYKDLMTDLNEFLGVQYAQLAIDDQLTMEILHEKGSYARFLEEVEQRVNKFSPEAAQEIRNTVQLTYKHAYEGMVKAVESCDTYEKLKVNLSGIRAATPDVIKNAVNNKYMEKALTKNHKSTIYEIRQQIAIGLSQGDRMSTMARRLNEQVNKSYTKAICIARTETHRVREAGYQDSSERISKVLKDNDSDYVMTKTWKTMEDMSVRPYRMKGKKGKKSFVMGKGPNHIKMHGKTILVEEEFELDPGVTAKAPGQSGNAGHDINCRCILIRELMTKAEYEALTGKKPVNEKIAQYEAQENILLDEKQHLEADKTKLEQRKQNLESYEYTGIWKDTVTPADYELKKNSIQGKRDYYNNELDQLKNRTGKYAGYDDFDAEIKISRFEQYLKELDEFEKQGKTYVKLSKQLADIDTRLVDIDDEVKAVRQKLMKANGIDPDKMQKEIDNIIDEINKLNKKKDIQAGLTINSKINEFEPGQINKIYKGILPNSHHDVEVIFGDSSVKDFIELSLTKSEQATFKKELKKLVKDDPDVSKLYDYDLGFGFKGKEYFTDKTIKADIDEAFKNYKKMPKSSMDPDEVFAFESLKDFFNELDDLQGTAVDKKAIKKLQKELKDKQDELDKVKKRYGLEDDKFSQRRKDNALWFTDQNGGSKAADKVYRPKAGEVWRKATKAQRDSAYEYTRSYHKYNEPLRGIEYGTNKFLGVGKVDLDDIGVSTGYGYKKGEVKKLIDDLTDYIDESTYDVDIWLNRGCRRSGMDKFFNVDINDFNLPEDELAAKILGTTPTEYGFMSTGVARGTGFSGEIKLNIYAPKGTRMAYVEPFSAFGNGHGKNWDGIKTQSSIGYEAEILVQRNTQFRVIKVEKQGSQWYIDMEVINQKR